MKEESKTILDSTMYDEVPTLAEDISSYCYMWISNCSLSSFPFDFATLNAIKKFQCSSDAASCCCPQLVLDRTGACFDSLSAKPSITISAVSAEFLLLLGHRFREPELLPMSRFIS